MPMPTRTVTRCPNEAVATVLYSAVAEVMAYVYQLNAFYAEGGLPPSAPTDIPVPAGMDPGSPDENR